MTRRALIVSAFSALPALPQEPSGILVERIASGLQFTDGPAYSRDGLFFSDVPADIIYRLTSGKPAVFRADAHGPAGNAFDSQGRLYTCETHSRSVTRTDKRGKVEPLAAAWDGKKLNSPHDLVIRKDGHAWFTDPAFGAAAKARELDFYGIFHLTPKGELTLGAKWKTRPNGITLSPDGKQLYVGDSDQHAVLRYDVDHAGELSNERRHVTGIEGVPGGLRTDAKGDLWIAANTIQVFDAAGRRTLNLGVAERAENLAFGDTDLSTLYVTARSGIYRFKLPVKGSGY